MMKNRYHTIVSAIIALCLSTTGCSGQQQGNAEAGKPEGGGQSHQVKKPDGTDTTLPANPVRQFASDDFPRLDTGAWREINAKTRDIKSHASAPQTGDYVGLALAYLMIGRFDSAMETLEECKVKAPPNVKIKAGFSGALQAAHDVKQTLTKARDGLIKQGMRVEYPDERIFLEALRSADKTDHRLILNLSDAYATAFPESRTALLNDGEQNLRFIESWPEPEDTNVSYWRTMETLGRGEAALIAAYLLDKDDPYPMVRLMRNVLETHWPKEGRPSIQRFSLNPSLEWFVAYGRLEDNQNVTNAQKAFLHYGRAMFFLYSNDGWQNGNHVDIGIDGLKRACQLAQNEKLYADALNQVQKDARKIAQAKLAKGKADRQRNRELASKMFGPGSTQSKQRANTFNLFLQGMTKLMHETVKKQHGEKGEKFVEMIESIGCPGCLGHGKNLYGGGTCEMCRGSKNWYNFNESK